MQPPLTPDDEALRLQALRAKVILDTPPEERFDRLTRLTQKALDVPIALVSLVDAERQWFKSRQGLEACETGRDISFCGHAILNSDIFEIPNALLDPRFADNPLVTGPPHIRFYAGAPLATAEGYRIGTLCIISDQPRQLTTKERAILRDLADSVEAEINQLEQHQKSEALAKMQQLGEIITRAQLQFIQHSDQRQAFDGLLTDLLALTESEYGFIGEVLRNPEGAPYLKTYAITNIAWNDDTRAFYQANAPQGMEFLNLKTLFGAALTSGKPVIANDPYRDPRRGGLPPGHPALNAFLGIPIHHGGELVAMAGLANRAEGYDQTLLDFLGPLLATVGQLVAAMRIKRKNTENEAILTRLSRVASQTTNGVVITDIEGRIEWVNDGFTRMTGHTLEDVLGHKPGELLQGPDTNAETVAFMRVAFARREAFDVDIVNYSKDGQRYWVHIACNPLLDEAGALQGFMAIQVDITREREDAERIRDSERRLAAVINGTRIGTWEWNVQTGETVFNQRWAEIIGYTLEELAPISINTWLNHTHADDLAASGELLERHFNGELDCYDFQCRMRHKLGHWVWVHDRGTVVSWTDDGKPLLISGTHADITEQKRIERMKSEFVATVSHELRTPLTSIAGALGLIASGKLGAPPAQMRQMLEIAQTNSIRLSYLINDLLDMEKLMAGKMSFVMQVQPLLPLLEQALHDNQAYADQFGVRLLLAQDCGAPLVKIDGQRLQQVLANFLSNAAKFSPKGGEVSITVECAEESVRVSVSDQGPGIAAEFRARVFEKFAQGDASDSRQKGGTGLGLAISRELVERMDGNIGFTSEEGNGATFYFELPLHRENAS